MSESFDTDQFVILGVPWKIRERPGALSVVDDCWGFADFESHTIHLTSSQPYVARLDTLLHEIVHVIANGLEKLDLTKEDGVKLFSSILTDTLTRNGIIPT